MSYLNMTTGTIKNKDTKKREPFLVVGVYSDVKKFKAELKEKFDPDSYDHRTVKFADCIGLQYASAFGVQTAVLNLEYLQEDLVDG